jgi:pimeloyl-ACP methyl ester carboxylesterase
MQANALSEPVARLLVERGLVPVENGFVWSSDPRLTLPTTIRMTEPQVLALVRGIECPTVVIHADPAQPYLPDDLRRTRAAALPRGTLLVLPGGHHLHMEQPQAVAAAMGDFFLRS